MRTPTLLAFLGFVAIAGIGLGAVAGGFPGSPYPWETTATEGPRITETGLHDFETTGPTCADPLPDNESTVSRSVPGGRRLSAEGNVSVAKRGTELRVNVEKIAPRRYHLALKRRPGGKSADCHLEIRYNATMNVSTPDSYTIVVTVDGKLETVLWSTPHASGDSSRTTADPDPGGSNETGNAGDGSGTGSE